MGALRDIGTGLAGLLPFGFGAATAAAGLSGAVKPIGYLLGAGFALWFAVSLGKRVPLGVWMHRVAGVLAVLTLVMAPSVARYTKYVDSDASINGSFGVRQTLDNLRRGGKLNFNTGIPKFDALTNRAVEVITSSLGLNAYRQDTTFPVGDPSLLLPPERHYILSEDYAPNPVHAFWLLSLSRQPLSGAQTGNHATTLLFGFLVDRNRHTCFRNPLGSVANQVPVARFRSRRACCRGSLAPAMGVFEKDRRIFSDYGLDCPARASAQRDTAAHLVPQSAVLPHAALRRARVRQSALAA
jgi:hypothetical protein